MQHTNQIQQILQHQCNEAISGSLGLSKVYAQGATHIIGGALLIGGTHSRNDRYGDIT